MLMPTIFSNDLFDGFFADPWGEQRRRPLLMSTDVKEKEQCFELTVDLPGVKKEDVRAELKDGYLTVSASSNSSRDEQDEQGRYLRRERYCGSMRRSFYVGEEVSEEDITASFHDGSLTLQVPKVEPQRQIEQKKSIAIQ